MILGIDASNIRDGGGVTHLRKLIEHMQPSHYGINHVVIWASATLLDALPNKLWLIKSYQRPLDRSLLFRIFWQLFILPRLIKKSCDMMFFPGGTATTKIKPYVTMNRNMLPFMPVERNRYGLSFMKLRLKLLAYLQTRTYRYSRGVIYLSVYASIQQQMCACVKGVAPHTLPPNRANKARTNKMNKLNLETFLGDRGRAVPRRTSRYII